MLTRLHICIIVFSMNLSEIVKAIIECGLSEQEIAEKAGCDKATINRIKNGKTADPRWSVGSGLTCLYQQLLTEGRIECHQGPLQ